MNTQESDEMQSMRKFARNVMSRTRLLRVLAAVFGTCLTVGDIIGAKLIQSETILGHSFIVTGGMRRAFRN